VKGFIYVLSNPSLPSLKIGQTKADPSERVKELTSSTSIPTPFIIEYYAYVDDYAHKEREIHGYFDDHRVNKKREFFDIDVITAISVIESLCTVLYAERLTDDAKEATNERVDAVREKINDYQETVDRIDELQEKLDDAVALGKKRAFWFNVFKQKESVADGALTYSFSRVSRPSFLTKALYFLIACLVWIVAVGFIVGLLVSESDIWTKVWAPIVAIFVANLINDFTKGFMGLDD